MLLTLFAFCIGCVIGRLRGGSVSGLVSARFHRPGLLVLGIATLLVLNLIGPAVPLLWAVVGMVSFIWFGFRNLQLAGMIVMLIGLLMNLAPMMANGSVPVSELALVSVGDVDASGHAAIDGLRESTETATAFSAFGDVIPVPVFNSVVSIGDLVMLVALADIVTNLFLRSRRSSKLDDGGVSFQAEAPSPQVAPVATPSVRSDGRPAHALHRRPRRKSASSSHIPAHAKESSIDLTNPETVIVLDGPKAYVEQPPAPRHAASPSGEFIEGPVPEIETPDAEAPDTEAAEEPTPVVVPKTEIIHPDEQTLRLQKIEIPNEDPEQATPTNAAPEQAKADQSSEPATSAGRREPATSGGSPDKTPAERSDQRREPATSGGSPDKNTVDRRPIIDLTNSPTDQQLQEFLRRRAQADAELAARRSPGPRRRRGRAPARNAEVAELRR